jgi:hypothetical protein
LAKKGALASAEFPFGGKEPYLDTELRASAFFDVIIIFPTALRGS